MKILEINIIGFGKLTNLNISLDEYVNVISGDNESGKSTISEFIYTLLYGFGTDSQEKRNLYRPWNSEVQYGGSILLECDGTVYKIDATLGQYENEDKISLFNITTNEDVNISDDKTIGEFLFGISADAFCLSSYANQLSTKPYIKNANIDYLYDHLMKKNEAAKQTTDEIAVGKRLNSAIDTIGSLKKNTGILGKLKEKQSATENSLAALRKAKLEAEEKRINCAKLEKELYNIKNKHSIERNDMSEVTKAVEVVTLHSEIKGYVSEINRIDVELADAVKKSKKIRNPIDIAYIILMVMCLLSFGILVFAEKISTLSFMEPMALKLLSISSRLSSYIIILIIAAFISVWNMILTFIFNKPVRAINEELTEKEEALFEMLGVEYFAGTKNRQFNRDNINIALNKHKNEYKFALFVLNNEDEKTKKYNEHLEHVEEYTEKISYIKASIDAIDKSINNMENEDELLYNLNEISQEIEKYSRIKKSLVLAKEAMEEAFQQWQTDVGPSFINEAGNILESITDGKYSEMKIARNFDISLKDSEGKTHSYYSYSGATIDQMYLSLRLSLIKMLSPANNMMPIILDNPFVQYDNKRKEKAYNVLRDFSSANFIQIILTTCSKESFPEEFNIIDLNS